MTDPRVSPAHDRARRPVPAKRRRPAQGARYLVTGISASAVLGGITAFGIADLRAAHADPASPTADPNVAAGSAASSPPATPPPIIQVVIRRHSSATAAVASPSDVGATVPLPPIAAAPVAPTSSSVAPAPAPAPAPAQTRSKAS
ncbi:MAG: hypothetical protein AB7V43_01910 [Acidimicrobiia bacterium]